MNDEGQGGDAAVPGAPAGRIAGRCLCGGVAFTVAGLPAEAIACHCTMCRRQSGHFWVSANIAATDLELTGAENLRWYAASEIAERGFCGTCGSFLFWRRPGSDRIAVAMGSLGAPTGAHIERHIFVAEKGDYYTIDDDALQVPGDD